MNNAGGVRVTTVFYYGFADHKRAISQLTRIGRSIGRVSSCANYSESQRSFDSVTVRFNWSNDKIGDSIVVRSHTAKNGPMRVSMRYDAMRCDAMWCDATHTMALIKRCRRAKNLRAKDFKARFGRRSQIIPGGTRRARGGKRQTSKFHIAPHLCYVLSFDPRTYSLTHQPACVHPMHVKFLLDLLARRVFD